MIYKEDIIQILNQHKRMAEDEFIRAADTDPEIQRDMNILISEIDSIISEVHTIQDEPGFDPMEMEYDPETGEYV